jgi:hypothetical protein
LSLGPRPWNFLGLEGVKCPKMIRFILFDILMAIIAFGFSWAARKVLGRLIHGPIVIVWGAVFGLLAIVGFGMFFVQVPYFGTFMNLDGDLFTGARVAFLYSWDAGLIGGILGVLLASFPRWNQKRVKPEDHPQA